MSLYDKPHPFATPPHLSEGGGLCGVCSGVIVLLNEVLVFLPLPAQCLLSTINVGRQVSLHTHTQTSTTRPHPPCHTPFYARALTQSSCHVVALTGGGTPDQLNFLSSSVHSIIHITLTTPPLSKPRPLPSYPGLCWGLPGAFQTSAIARSPCPGGQSNPPPLQAVWHIKSISPAHMPCPHHYQGVSWLAQSRTFVFNFERSEMPRGRRMGEALFLTTSREESLQISRHT